MVMMSISNTDCFLYSIERFLNTEINNPNCLSFTIQVNEIDKKYVNYLSELLKCSKTFIVKRIISYSLKELEKIYNDNIKLFFGVSELVRYCFLTYFINKPSKLFDIKWSKISEKYMKESVKSEKLKEKNNIIEVKKQLNKVYGKNFVYIDGKKREIRGVA